MRETGKRDLSSIFHDSEGRYLHQREQRALLSYARTVEIRLAALRDLEEHESQIVQETFDRTWKTYPELAARFPNGEELCTRDLGMVLQHCAMAMIRDDINYLEEHLLHWLRTILQSFFGIDVIDTCYATLIERVEAHLQPKHAALYKPFLRSTRQLLTTPS